MPKKIYDLLSDVRDHVVMRDYTTFKVGGVADYFIEANTVDQLVRAVKAALSLKIPYFILGNGSNILLSDYGFPGLVIKNKTSSISFMEEKSQVIADSGVMLSKLIMESISHDLAGLEFLYGIPGTVGGSVYGDAGANGSAIGDYVRSLTLLEIDPEDNIPKIVQREASWMNFGYRTTRLKEMKSKNKPVILSVRFQFSRNQQKELMRRINMYKEKRVQTQPIGLLAGCIFKNPIPNVLKNITGSGTRGMPELPKERTAGFMLDKSGAKKLQTSHAVVSNKHANFVVNKDGAKATEIRTLIEQMRERVRSEFNVTLEEEIEYIGQW